MSTHIHGTNHSKWWIFRGGKGTWIVVSPPEKNTAFAVYKFPSGAEALKAFADGRL